MRITRKRARKINRAATFEGNSDTPAVVVGGVAVHVYVKASGRLIISAHFDTGEVLPELLTEGETVPVAVDFNGTRVLSLD